MASYPPPATLQVTVDTERFVQTRNALTSAYIGLSNSIDTAIKAYIAHTDVVIQGAGTFDISQLLLPFQGAAGAAQVAEQAIQNGLIQVASLHGDLNGHVVADPKKKEKRPYKPRDPNAPKRPLTAYFRFLKEVRPFIAQEVAQSSSGEPGTNKAGDISKIATERWKAMTDDERKPYHDAYKGEMGGYEEATKAYKAEGGKLEDNAESPDAEVESPSALAVNGVTPGAEEESDESSSEEDSSSEEESEDEVPAKLPPPPAPKAEKKTPKAKKVKAAADANIDPQLTAPVANMAAPPTPFTAPPLSQQPSTVSKKRKAAEETPGTAKKRGRPSKEEKAAKDAAALASAAAALHQPVPESSQADTTSGTEKKKKKKRKSEAAGTV